MPRNSNLFEILRVVYYYCIIIIIITCRKVRSSLLRWYDAILLESLLIPLDACEICGDFCILHSDVSIEAEERVSSARERVHNKSVRARARWLVLHPPPPRLKYQFFDEGSNVLNLQLLKHN